ncbi:unnamed protein product, partial [Amoebophrya sp. A25]
KPKVKASTAGGKGIKAKAGKSSSPSIRAKAGKTVKKTAVAPKTETGTGTSLAKKANEKVASSATSTSSEKTNIGKPSMKMTSTMKGTKATLLAKVNKVKASSFSTANAKSIAVSKSNREKDTKKQNAVMNKIKPEVMKKQGVAESKSKISKNSASSSQASTAKTKNNNKPQQRVSVPMKKKGKMISISAEELREKLWTLKVLRADKNSPVDIIGCNMLADEGSPDAPFHHLVAAMLSAQTKDVYTADAMKNLKAFDVKRAGFESFQGSLSVAKILAMTEDEIDYMIHKVGFHQQKAANIVKTAQVLHDRHDSRVPCDKEALLALPGVGPKMTYLVLQEAFGQGDSGICVDVHVHKLCPKLGWTSENLKDAEKTRVELEALLPKEEWKTINPLLVGLGQLLQARPEMLVRQALWADTVGSEEALAEAVKAWPPPKKGIDGGSTSTSASEEVALDGQNGGASSTKKTTKRNALKKHALKQTATVEDEAAALSG